MDTVIPCAKISYVKVFFDKVKIIIVRKHWLEHKTKNVPLDIESPHATKNATPKLMRQNVIQIMYWYQVCFLLLQQLTWTTSSHIHFHWKHCGSI